MFKIPFTNIVLGKQPKTEREGFSYGTTPLGTLIGQTKGNKFTPRTMFEMYRDSSDIYGCIREWCQSVGLGGVEYVDPKDKEAKVSDVLIQEVDSVLNYYQTFRRLLSNTVRDLGITGNAYWEIVKNEAGTKIVALARIDPRMMRIISDKHGTILKYIQTGQQGESVTFEANEIIHYKLDVDPDNEVFGFSPMEPILWEARIDQSSKMTNYYFYENKAQPGVWYVLEDGLSKEAKEKAINLIKEQLSGPQNAYKSTILDGVKEIKTFDLTNKDMEYLLGRKYSTEKICAAYGVPKFLLGYTEDTNYSNGREMMRKFYEGTIQPIEEGLTETINRYLIALLGYENKIRVQFKPMSFNEQSQLEQRALTELQAGAITLRQYKQKTGQEVTPEDEKQVNFDAYVIHSGASALLLEDVGIDPVFDTTNTDQVNSILSTIEKKYDLSKLK